MKYKNTASFVQALQKVLNPFLRKNYASVRVGECTSASGKVAYVTLGGAGISAQRYCNCKAGDKVLVLVQGNTFYAIGVRQ